MTEPPRLAPLPAPFTRGVPLVFALSAAAAAFAGGLALTVTRGRPVAPSPAIDPCALPAGFDLADLSDRDRSYVTHHLIACNDFEHQRISGVDYKRRLDAIEAASQAPVAPPLPPAPIWASTIREASSQYTATSWAAARALGAPDVYPASGDNANAWASLQADAPVETLEVGFSEPHRLRGVEVLETYNPGAVSHVEVITADGVHRTIYDGAPAPMNVPSYRRAIDFACTAQPVIAVRVTLASQAVPGWNEIDAIGGTRCD